MRVFLTSHEDRLSYVVYTMCLVLKDYHMHGLDNITCKSSI